MRKRDDGRARQCSSRPFVRMDGDDMSFNLEEIPSKTLFSLVWSQNRKMKPQQRDLQARDICYCQFLVSDLTWSVITYFVTRFFSA